jgi:drug/metabolite transporter (DMT)-like permease
MLARMTATPPHHPLRGVSFFLSGVFLFACMDTATKYLTSHYAVPVVVAARYMVHCLLMVIVLAPVQGRKLIETERTGMVLVRAACLAAGSLVFGLALQRMPVAEASAIVFVAPLLVVLMAGRLLDEQVGPLGWTAAVTGFAGVLLIARPGGDLDAAGIIFALCAAALTAAYQLLSRVLASTERTVALLFYTALVGAVFFGALLPWFWGGERPTTWQSLVFLGTGALGAVGHFLYTAAYRDAPASALAPLQYMQLIWAGLLGWFAFGHVPEGLSVLGMCVVAVSGALVAVRSHLAAQAPEEAPER